MKFLQDNKAIICADLHIDNYIEYNPTDDELKDILINPLDFKNKSEYRLNQIYMIALRIIYECKKYNIHTVFILGDLIMRSNCSPLVLNTLRQFLKLITDENIFIYYILGQHDLRKRITDPNIKNDTFVSTVRNSKCIYSHNKQFKMNNHIIEMRNFDFDNSIIEVNKNTEIFLTHQSIGGFGQSSKGKSLKMVIAGDIHDKVDEIKNNIEYHSTMTPFQIYPHQHMNGYISLLDCSSEKPIFTRISSSGTIYYNNKELNFKLFDILTSKDYKNSLLNQKLENIKKEEIKIDNNDLITKFDIRNSGNIENSVKNLVKENNFEDLYSELVINDIPKPLNMNFKLKSLHIENFRSIDNMTFNFEDNNGLTFISAENGAGKSSILLAIEYALTGGQSSNRFKKEARKDNNEVYPLLLDIVLEYNNDKYEIIRKNSKTDFLINNKSSKLGKRETESEILEKLPFINYIKYFICHANSHFFDNVDRTQLIIDIFNLNFLQGYQDSINELKESIKENIKDIKINKVTYENQLQEYQNDKNNCENKINELEKDTIIKIDSAKTKLSYFNDLKLKIENCKSNMNTYKSLIDSNKKSLSDYDSSKYDIAINCLKEHELRKKLKQQIENAKVKLNIKQSELKSLRKLRQKILTTPKCKCPDCGSEFYLNDISSRIDECNTNISQKEVEVKKIEGEIDFVSTGISDNNIELSETECISIINNKKLIENIQNQLNNNLEKYQKEKDIGNTYFIEKQKLLNNLTDKEYEDLLNKNIEYNIRKESLQSELNNINNKIDLYSKKIIEVNNKLDKLIKKYSRCEQFLLLFDMKNLDSIPYQIIKKVTESLNNNKIRFKTTKELSNGEDRFDINAEIRIAENVWMDYDSSSDGQKVILDVFILYSILSNINKIGLLILDEQMANCDNEKVDFISNVIERMKKYCNNILITSHSDYFNRYDHIIELKLDESGLTKII